MTFRAIHEIMELIQRGKEIKMRKEIIEIKGKDYEVVIRKVAKPNVQKIGITHSLVVEQVVSKELWVTYQRKNGQYTKPVKAY